MAQRQEMQAKLQLSPLILCQVLEALSRFEKPRAAVSAVHAGDAAAEDDRPP